MTSIWGRYQNEKRSGARVPNQAPLQKDAGRTGGQEPALPEFTRPCGQSRSGRRRAAGEAEPRRAFP